MNSQRGFTLIELLVVVVIIGILSAIAVPTFLNQTAKAKQSQAKTTIGAVNQAQSAYRLDHTQFAGDLNTLALGLPSVTNNYSYSVAGGIDTATILAQAKDTVLKGYAGGNVRLGNAADGQSAIASLVCEVNAPGTGIPPLPALDNSATDPDSAAKCDPLESKL